MNKIDQTSNVRRINPSLTKRVMALQSLGYIFDFQMLDIRTVLCLQDNALLPIEDVQVKLIDQSYDQLTNSFKYIHTVETCCGKRGLLLADKIAGLCLSWDKLNI